MTLLRALLALRAPLAALALCALLAQQMIGFVLVAAPALALENGFSLCLSGPPAADDDPLGTVEGAGFCPCTQASGLALLPPSSSIAIAFALAPATFDRARESVAPARAPAGPPPPRAPPLALHG